MSEIIQILLADDHPVVRRGLRAALEDDERLQVIAEAADGNEALRQMEALNPSVAVLDIDMPGMNGLAVAREALQKKLPTRIIFMTFHADEDLMRAAMESGGQGYLLKGSETDEVCAAIHAVHAGRTYIGSTMAAVLLTQASQRRDVPSSLKLLTPTERKILRLIADGLSSKEIGDALSIHYRTVENHRTNMCRKLEVEGANALARFALHHRAVLQERLL
ncbi:response regulator [Terriglobus roseus]|uniref:Two component transcriptional regulator, LuxR family n=1 Tax=Terriglobus roseus TaxID=392734 RepID=A0A1H4JXF2_9BACT|nr:response regulator transcription factor [Terriglobus roseus]SEB50538.1 two component transcriptional regulator, LuxR family [Terriglobus roseus]